MGLQTNGFMGYLRWIIGGLMIALAAANVFFLHMPLGILLLAEALLLFAAFVVISIIGILYLLARFVYSLLRNWKFCFGAAAVLAAILLLDPEPLVGLTGWLAPLAAILALVLIGGLDCLLLWLEDRRIREWIRRYRAQQRRRTRGARRRPRKAAAKWYRALGVPQSASWPEVREAYRTLALKYHPDVNKNPDAEARMKAINEAYERLEMVLSR